MINTERILSSYAEIYKALYRRAPSELRDLGEGWVLVNGARMTVRELELLTHQLQLEMDSDRARKRSLVSRLLGWFNN